MTAFFSVLRVISAAVNAAEIKKNLKLDLFWFNFRYAGRLKAKKREMVVESDFHHKEKVLNHSLSQINFFTRGDL